MTSKYMFFAVAAIAVVAFVECYPALDETDPEAICHLPPAKGFCRALIPRWTYDASSGECVEFKFGGCAGNANNFPTKDDCDATCAYILKK